MGKQTRRLLAIVLSVMLVFSIIPLSAFTVSAETYGAFTYEVYGSEVTITGLVDNNTAGAIEIPAEIDGYPVTEIEKEAFYNCDYITSVAIPATVTKIKVAAFKNCDNLQSVTMNEGLEEIGGNWASGGAFDACTSLKSIELPDTVKSLGYGAFSGCTSLGSVKLSNTLNSIDSFAFSGCIHLKSVNIPKSLLKVSNSSVFGNCESLETVTFEEGITKIQDYLFSDCTGLKEITIPETVKTIGIAAFKNCSSLETVTMYEGIEEIGGSWASGGAFEACTLLKNIELPDTVKSLGYGAFSGCTSLGSIKFSSALKSIASFAFSDCTVLEDVNYNGFELQKDLIDIKDGNDILLNATWHCKPGVKYNVIYTLNGGTNNAGNPKTYVSGSATFTLKNPTRSGYKFVAWYSDSALKTKNSQIVLGTEGDVNFYAKWEKLYTLTYKLNSGTNSKSNPKNFAASTATFTLKNPTRKGYTFKGWYTNAKFTGSKVTKIAKGTKKNITLYAKWSKNTYKITYKLNKGKNNNKNPKTYTVTSSVSLKNPTRKGYKFKGWYSDSKFKKKVTKIAKGSTGNKTLYAKWAKK